jgi:signal recognition particle receptor subunit beta
MLIWDLEGHTKFKAIAPTYLQGGSGAVIVADVTRQETVERINEHIKLFLSVNPKGFIVLALNKSDLLENEKLTTLTHLVQLQYSEQVLGVYQASAKTGSSVDEIFNKLGESIMSSV